jgi:CheY-like chemotaxis protein
MSPFEGKRILVVEDEPLVAMLLEEMLLELGCQVVGPAFSIAEASRMAEEEALDAAVLDVNVNGEWSYSVAAILTARAVPFAYATGYGSAVGDGAGRGAPTLHKPYPAGRLADVLDELLGG